MKSTDNDVKILGDAWLMHIFKCDNTCYVHIPTLLYMQEAILDFL